MSDPASTQPSRRRILPPYIVRRDFLPAAMVAELLAFAEANEARFVSTKVGVGEGAATKPAVRISSMLRDFAPLKDDFKAIMRPLAPAIAAELKVKPFEVSRVEVELIAHGDGAFYSRHIDTMREGDGTSKMRLLSGVYYFHAQPKAFEGGALRLHELMPARDDEARFVDIEPAHNSCVFFPSWMPHEVMPVRCPSKRFADSRFAVNCWFRRAA